MKEPSPLIQVILGPRQVGKTTGVLQMQEKHSGPSFYVSADDTLNASNRWIEEQWQAALEKGPGTLLIIDEIQKIQNWAEVIKRLWDAQARSPRKLKCVLLGSSSLTLQKGLSESLAGRFELIAVHHWSYPEWHKAFGDSLDLFLRYGGYPAAHAYQKDYARWFSYLKSSVVDMVVGQDILSQNTVAKPALFRQAFEILCGYPAQEVSYNKLLGQLHDRGNTDLVKHYLELYEGAFLFRGLTKYSGKIVKSRTSSPKILPMCPALYTLAAGSRALDDPEKRGHVFEAAVGVDLLRIPEARVFYWRDGDHEVDFVIHHEDKLYALEVKSGRRRAAGGLSIFQTRFRSTKTCLIRPENYLAFAQSPMEFLQSMSVL
jgi:predicted AAA+ superfamily ATPase